MYRPGLHFDNLVENSRKAITSDQGRKYSNRVLNRAALFVMEGAAKDTLPKEYTDEEIEWYCQNFHLPFPITAVEDESSVVILHRPDMSICAQEFVGSIFRFINWMPSKSSGRDAVDYDASGKTIPGKIDPSELPEEGWGSYDKGMLAFGTLKIVASAKTEFQINGEVAGIIGIDAGKILNSIDGAQIEPRMQYHMLHEANVAIQQVMLINSPKRFVLEDRPAVIRENKGKHAKRVKKSHERSLFRVLTPNVIRATMKVPQLGSGSTSSRGGGDVRSHPRTFRNERYTNMRGKTVIIPAHWRGPLESVVSGRKYIVRLDL